MSSDGTERSRLCMMCGDSMRHSRDDSRICGTCEIEIQTTRLLEGVRCDRCGGHGYVYGSICDVQRAMNGRDTPCSDCNGSGRVPWEPDLEDVHPDLRMQVAWELQPRGEGA